MLIQLDLFEEVTESDMLRQEIFKVRETTDKTRKSLFARHGELAKKYMDLQERLAILEHHICKR